ncbi:MFS transporter [Saccharobesus litoralis]|uniref:MFS transporter n=1 Tax=Saccharobesus litoralis TaxID=2172099 RepID=A0A2S0VXG0_9ALTE|nr:MFS transporter [Saccharobesus litoralis]AWB68894.1 MFS transporter [Saccharobesus litoralis]
MDKFTKAAIMFSAIVAFGGFVFGLDAALISGTTGYLTSEFGLDDLQLGNVVSAPALGVLLALVVTGAICESIGRKKTLILIAALYIVSAVTSVIAPSYEALVAARFLGGLAFASLSMASMYIGEIAPAKQRGKLVSTNQIMIVVGLTTAYFANYFLVGLTTNDPEFAKEIGLLGNEWRWMLGVEVIPAVLWGILLLTVPESPRWLISKGRIEEAKQALSRLMAPEKIDAEVEEVRNNLKADGGESLSIIDQLKILGEPKFRLAIMVGVIFAAVQPLTGVNPILFYAPMVFEQTGIGANAAYAQTLIIGVVSFIFTVLAIVFVDKIGRRPLVNFGLAASVACLLMCVIAFQQATYTLDAQDIATLVAANSSLSADSLQTVIGVTYSDDTQFKTALAGIIGAQEFKAVENQFIQAAVSINATLVLVGIVGFIAAFHISIGPIMWVVFSEIVPTQIRGVAIPLFALISSTISYFMQKFFPWMLNQMGGADVFMSFVIAGGIGFILLYRYLPETKGRTIEEIEHMMAGKHKDGEPKKSASLITDDEEQRKATS